MKYKSKYPIIMGDKVYPVKDGICDLPYELGNTFERVEDLKPRTDDKKDLINKAYDLGLGSPSTLKRLSEETLKQRIEEAE